MVNVGQETIRRISSMVGRQRTVGVIDLIIRIVTTIARWSASEKLISIMFMKLYQTVSSLYQL